MAPPLLNEYKIKFALNRIFKNVSGGPSFAPRDSGVIHHIFVFINSIIFFLLPLILSIILQTLLGQTLVSAVIMGGVFILLHAVIYVIALRYESSVFRNEGRLGFLDDSEPALEGNAFSATFKYIFVKEKEARVGFLGQLVRLIIVGVYLGVLSYWLNQPFFSDRFGSSGGSAFYALVWIGICMTHWPLLCKKPVEPNTYHTEDAYALDDYSRLLHFSCIFVVIALELPYPLLQIIDLPLLWTLVCLPLLWSIGLLPSFRVSLETGLERIHTCLLAGSPTMNNIQLMSLLFIKTLLGLLLPICLFQMNSSATALITSSALSCVLASRLLPDYIFTRTVCLRSTQLIGIEPFNTPFKKYWPYYYLLIRTGIKVGLGIVFVTASFSSSMHPWTSSFSLLVVILTLLKKATREIQQAHIPSIWPIFLNPIEYSGKKFQAFFFKGIGFLHNMTSIPLDIITQSFIFLNLIPSSFSLFSDSAYTLFDAWKVIMIYRAFSSVSHTPEVAGTECCLTMLVNYLISNQPSLGFSVWWSGLDFGSQLFLVHVFKAIYLRLSEKSHFWLISLNHFLFSKKELHPSWPWWIVPIFTISPITIIISSILDTPSVPYLGLPFLILSFPRPKRFWESMGNEYASGRDVPLYMSLAPTLIQELSKAIRDGKIPTLDPGGAFLARFESRIMIIRGVEQWFEGASSIVTATELEPTSCHALEGLAVDDVLDKTLDPSNRTWKNHHLLNTLSPVGTLKTKGYLESQQITTGILTNNSYTTTFPPLFFKVLGFYLMKKMRLDQLTSYRGAPINPALMVQVKTGFPVLWFDLVKQNSSDYRSSTKSMTMEKIEVLNETLSSVVTSAFIVMLGSALGSNSTQLYMSVLFDLYKGKLSYSVQPDLRTWFQNPARKPFRILCIEAFRYTFKYLYDSSVLQESIEDMQPLYDSLEEMTDNWVATVDPAQQAVDDPTDPSKRIDEGIKSGIKGVFQLYLKKQGEPLRVRQLTQSDECQVKIAKMNKEALMGIWANLTYELLYLTNDDDERFSIQAHQLLLRNLSVQIAFPPFGYPLWIAPAVLNSSYSLSLESLRPPRRKQLYQEKFGKVSPEPSAQPKPFKSSLPLYKIHPMQDEDLFV